MNYQKCGYKYFNPRRTAYGDVGKLFPINSQGFSIHAVLRTATEQAFKISQQQEFSIHAVLRTATV